MKPVHAAASIAALALALSCGGVAAQAWPTKPIRVVITFAPGGSSDIVARLLSAPLQEKLGQTIGVNDLHIAAHARSEGLVLVTNNVDVFDRVPSLQIENWVAS